MSFEIPEFSDDLAHCDPCGWPEADTEYVPAIVGIAGMDRIRNPFGGDWPVFAFLKRTCTRCGFQWAEARARPRVRRPRKRRFRPLESRVVCKGPCCEGDGPEGTDH